MKYPYAVIIKGPDDILHLVAFTAGEFLDEALEQLKKEYTIMLIQQPGETRLPKAVCEQATIF